MADKDVIAKNNDVAGTQGSGAGASTGAPDRTDMRELGQTGLKRFSGFLYEEFLKELTGERAIEVYKEMGWNDPTCYAILFAITMLCRRVKWFVEAASIDNREDQAAGEFLETCMNDMSSTWIDTLTEILSMLQYGYSVHEIVYKRRCGDVFDPSMRSKYEDGRIGWRKIPIRSQDSIYRWQFDDHGGIQGVEQLAPPHYYRITIPVEKMLLFRTTTFKNNPEGQSVLRGAYRCFSEDTELLTDRGWQLLSEMDEDAQVATLNRDTGAIEYEMPSERQLYWHDGEMVSAESRYVDQFVTPNHRMWVRGADQETFKFVEASECKPSYSFSCYGDWKEPGIRNFEIAGQTVEANAWLAFLGIWLAEGHTHQNKTKEMGCVGLTQNEGKKADEIRVILSKLPWHFSETSQDKLIHWRHHRKELRHELLCFGKAKDKFIPRKILNEASKAQLQILLDAYYLGDGTTTGDRDGYEGTKRVCTISDRLSDDLMEAAIKCGHRATKRWHATQGGFSVGCWMVALGKQFAGRMRASWSTRDYQGFVYCVTTRNGVVLCRRNGKASWSGQSWYMKKQIENIEAVGVERDLAGLPIALVPPEIMSKNASQDEKAQYAAIQNIVLNIRRNAMDGVVFPQNYDATGKLRYELKLLSSGGSRQFDTSAIVNRYDQRMAMTVLADFMLLGQDKVGSFALSSSKTNLFATAIGAFLDIIADVFNRYAIPRLFALNDFSITDYPQIKHGNLGSVDLNELGTFLRNCAQSGIMLAQGPDAQKHLMEIAGIPTSDIPEEETESFIEDPSGKAGTPDEQKDEGKGGDIPDTLQQQPMDAGRQGPEADTGSNANLELHPAPLQPTEVGQQSVKPFADNNSGTTEETDQNTFFRRFNKSKGKKK